MSTKIEGSLWTLADTFWLWQWLSIGRDIFPELFQEMGIPPIRSHLDMALGNLFQWSPAWAGGLDQRTCKGLLQPTSLLILKENLLCQDERKQLKVAYSEISSKRFYCTLTKLFLKKWNLRPHLYSKTFLNASNVFTPIKHNFKKLPPYFKGGKDHVCRLTNCSYMPFFLFFKNENQSLTLKTLMLFSLQEMQVKW